MYKLMPHYARKYFKLFSYTLHAHIHLHASIKSCIRYIKYEMPAKMQLNMPTCATGLAEHHSPQLTYALLLWLYCCSFFSGQSLWLYRQTQKEKHIHGQCSTPSASGISQSCTEQEMFIEGISHLVPLKGSCCAEQCSG